jgi:hypothetical protein
MIERGPKRVDKLLEQWAPVRLNMHRRDQNRRERPDPFERQRLIAAAPTLLKDGQ